MKSLVIITGANRGLGQALRLYSRQMNYDLLLLQRKPGDSISGEKTCLVDMEFPDSYLNILHQELSEHSLKKYERLILVNNAAVIEPISPVTEMDPESVSRAIQINLTSPIHLSQRFLKLTEGFHGFRILVNISSGAAYRPIPSWSIYCATKAGLKMFTECLAAESQGSDSQRRSKDRFLSFSPGIMNTDMQAQIRSSPEKNFPLVEKFRSFQEKNQLANPEDVARGLFKFIDRYLSSEEMKLQKYDWDVQEINLQTGEHQS